MNSREVVKVNTRKWLKKGGLENPPGHTWETASTMAVPGKLFCLFAKKFANGLPKLHLHILIYNYAYEHIHKHVYTCTCIYVYIKINIHLYRAWDVGPRA